VLDEYLSVSPKVGDLDGETFELRYKRVQDYLQKFPRAPFTLQRMAELLTEPRRYYNSTAKFFLAFSKLVCGISARNFDQEAVEDAESGTFGKNFSGLLPAGALGFSLVDTSLAGDLLAVPTDSKSSFQIATVMPAADSSAEITEAKKKQKVEVEGKEKDGKELPDRGVTDGTESGTSSSTVGSGQVPMTDADASSSTSSTSSSSATTSSTTSSSITSSVSSETSENRTSTVSPMETSD